MQERIEGLRRSVAGTSQRLQAPKTWLGSESVNVLQILGDLIDLVQQMNTNWLPTLTCLGQRQVLLMLRLSRPTH